MQRFTNAARALLTAGLAAGSTSIMVEPAHADLFPVANTGSDAVGTVGKDWFKAVLQNGMVPGIEIVYVRTRPAGSGVLADVVRGREGTTAMNFPAGTVIGLRLTAQDYEQALDLSASASTFMRGMLPAPDGPTARAYMGVAIGTDVQAQSANLQSMAGLAGVADRMPYFTAPNTLGLATLTAGGRALAGAAGTANTLPYFSAANTVSLQAVSAGGRALLNNAGTINTFPYYSAANTVALQAITAQGRSLVAGADAAAQRATLGLGSMATQAASAVAITGGAIDGTPVGAATRASGAFTSLSATGSASIGENLTATGYVSAGGNLYVNGSNIEFWRAAQNTAIIQHDGNHMYLRPQNAGSQLYLGANGLASVTIANDTASTLSVNQSDAVAVNDRRPALQLRKGGVTRLQISADGSSGGVGAIYYEALGAQAQHQFFVGSGVALAIGGVVNPANFLSVRGSGSGSGPEFVASGPDAHISIGYNTKGLGNHFFNTGGGPQMVVADTPGSIDYVTAYGGASGGYPLLAPRGASINSNIGLIARGTGAALLGSGNGLGLTVDAASSAVNRLRIMGRAAGNPVLIEAAGDDPNVGIDYRTKVDGTHDFYRAGSRQVLIGGSAGAVNYLELVGRVTGAGPQVLARGSDLHINLQLGAKGNGVVTTAFPLALATPNLGLQTACRLFATSGAPSNSDGQDGDICFRGNGGAGSTIYHKRSGAWVGIV